MGTYEEVKANLLLMKDILEDMKSKSTGELLDVQLEALEDLSNAVELDLRFMQEHSVSGACVHTHISNWLEDDTASGDDKEYKDMVALVCQSVEEAK